MLIRDEIVLTFRRIAEAQSQRLAPLTDELKLTECGLDSVGFMLVVASLEESVKVDPFDSLEGVDFPVTLRDFIALYEPHRA
jgi:aryl carrier-like protein